VVERFQETPGARRRRQVDAGRREDPQIHGLRARRAQAAHAARLEGGEELALQGPAQRADLVEEERAAAGDLEHAGLGRVRVGEGAALVAEELRLEEVVRMAAQSTATNGPARAARRGATGWRGRSCRPRLALDQDRWRAVQTRSQEALDAAADGAHGRAVSEERFDGSAGHTDRYTHAGTPSSTEPRTASSKPMTTAPAGRGILAMEVGNA
jgi:hypothetical protein